MRTDDPEPVNEIVRAYNDQSNRPITIDVVKPATRQQIAVRRQFTKTGGPCHRDSFCNKTDLGLRPAHKVFVVFGKCEYAATLAI